MRQLLPAYRDRADPGEVYGDPPRPPGRPGVRVSMIASADGATALDGVSGGLGGPGDRAVYMALRARADIVLVGAGTVRAERYGPPLLPEEAMTERVMRGQEPLPRIAVVSRSCHLDWDAPVFGDGRSRPLVVTVAGAPADRRHRAAEVADVVLAGERDVEPRACLAELWRRGARAVLAEGGPTLNAHLAAAGLVDELCLTIAPRLAGGDSHRILAGPPAAPAAMALASLCEEDGFLFARYRAAA